MSKSAELALARARMKAHADSLASVPHNAQFRADLYTLSEIDFEEFLKVFRKITRRYDAETEEEYSGTSFYEGRIALATKAYELLEKIGGENL